jgi:tetratricopeptide (TPR) repeat protein
MQAGRYPEVLDLCRETNLLEVADAEIWFIAGSANAALHNFEDAIRCYEQVLLHEPSHYKAHDCIGLALMYLGRLEEALTCFQKALDLNPNYARAHRHAGGAYYEQGRYYRSIESLQQALHIDPSQTDARVLMGDAYLTLGKLEPAGQCYRTVLEAEPDNAAALAGEICILEKNGKLREAYNKVTELLDKGVSTLEIAALNARLAPCFGQQKQAIELLETRLHAPGLPPFRVSEIHFMLGRLYDSDSDYDHAFEHFRAAHENRKGSFDIRGYETKVNAITGFFTRERMRSLPVADTTGHRPVFIVGMPRSGTTLVEQIIGSHPAVTACGELGYIPRAVQMLPDALAPDTCYPHCLQRIHREQLNYVVENYLRNLRELHDVSVYFTDKTLLNYEHIGLLEKLFPDARVINCLRDPLDVCLSCYFQTFTPGSIEYVHELEDLGHTYSLYADLLTHWKSVVNIPVHEVRYEELVSDPESHIRELLQFCGLPWDERCLAYDKSGRLANTASYNQVRRPIYTSSIGRWQKYRHHLGPLLAILQQTHDAYLASLGKPGSQAIR